MDPVGFAVPIGRCVLFSVLLGISELPGRGTIYAVCVSGVIYKALQCVCILNKLQTIRCEGMNRSIISAWN